MDKSLLIGGGTSYGERLEEALRIADITQESYRKCRLSAERELVGKKLFLPMYVEMGSPYGERWAGFFQMIENTEDNQTIIIRKGQFFPCMKELSLLKRGYLLPARRWGNQVEKVSVRKALGDKLSEFNLDGVVEAKHVPSGLDFSGGETYKPTSPYDWLRGGAMLEFPWFRDGVKVKIQVGKADYSQALSGGVRLVATGINSLSGEEAPHEITIDRVPVYLLSEGVTELAYRVGYGIHTSDGCKRSVFSEDKFGREIRRKKERTGPENEFDHHSYFVLKIAGKQIGLQYPDLAIDDIFPDLQKGVEDLIEPVFRRVVIVKRNGNGKEEREMLWQSVSLMQACTMMAVGYVNMKEKLKATA